MSFPDVSVKDPALWAQAIRTAIESGVSEHIKTVVTQASSSLGDESCKGLLFNLAHQFLIDAQLRFALDAISILPEKDPRIDATYGEHKKSLLERACSLPSDVDATLAYEICAMLFRKGVRIDSSKDFCDFLKVFLIYEIKTEKHIDAAMASAGNHLTLSTTTNAGAAYPNKIRRKTSLHIFYDEPEIMLFILKELGKDAKYLVNQGNERGATPLHFAVASGYVSVVEELLSAGAAIDAVDDQGRQPLHWAADAENAPVVTALLKAGAKIDAVDKKGAQPLHLAAFSLSEKGDALETLIAAGASLTAPNEDGHIPLHIALLRYTKVLRELGPHDARLSGFSKKIDRILELCPESINMEITVWFKKNKQNITIERKILPVHFMLMFNNAREVALRILRKTSKEALSANIMSDADLFVAVCANDFERVRAWLEQGIGVRATQNASTQLIEDIYSVKFVWSLTLFVSIMVNKEIDNPDMIRSLLDARLNSEEDAEYQGRLSTMLAARYKGITLMHAALLSDKPAIASALFEFYINKNEDLLGMLNAEFKGYTVFEWLDLDPKRNTKEWQPLYNKLMAYERLRPERPFALLRAGVASILLTIAKLACFIMSPVFNTENARDTVDKAWNKYVTNILKPPIQLPTLAAERLDSVVSPRFDMTNPVPSVAPSTFTPMQDVNVDPQSPNPREKPLDLSMGRKAECLKK